MSLPLHRYYIATTIASITGTNVAHAIRIATPSNRLARISKFRISTRGTSASDNPPVLTIQRGVSGGLSAGSAGTAIPDSPHIPTSACTLTTQMSGTATGGTQLSGPAIPAAASVYTEPQDLDTAFSCAVSSFLDVFVAATGSTITNCTVEIWWDE